MTPTPDAEVITAAQCQAIPPTGPVCPSTVTGDACKIHKDRIIEKCSKYDSIFEKLKSKLISLQNNAVEIILSIIILILTTALTWLSRKIEHLRTRSAELASRIFDPFFKLPNDYEQLATNLILIGDGGSGKTTLIHALSASEKATPERATDAVSTYTLVNEISIETKQKTVRRLCRIYCEDYVGQNWIQGTNNELLRKRQENIKSSTLVIVVDLFAPGRYLSADGIQNEPQKSRIRDQLKTYNETSLQTLRHLLNDGGQIVLFINKFDLLSTPDRESRTKAIECYAPLIGALEHIRGTRLHVIVGSAATGLGVVGYDRGQDALKSLYQVVIENAERLELR